MDANSVLLLPSLPISPHEEEEAPKVTNSDDNGNDDSISVSNSKTNLSKNMNGEGRVDN